MKKGPIKNVDRKQCVGTLIFSLFAIATLFIPFIIRETTFAFNYAPILGDGSWPDMLYSYVLSAFKLLEMEEIVLNNASIINTICSASFFIFYGIVLFDFLFSLILIIFPCNVLRIIVKVFTIIFGFVMILTTILHVMFIIGFIAYLTNQVAAGVGFREVVQVGGIIYLVVVTMFCYLLMSKQFKWFRRYY